MRNDNMFAILFYTVVFTLAAIGLITVEVFVMLAIRKKRITGQVAYDMWCFFVGVTDGVMRKLFLWK